MSFGGEGGIRRGHIVTMTMAIHNIPEGVAISLALVPRGLSVFFAVLWCILSSIPQPIFAVPSFIFVEQVCAFFAFRVAVCYARLLSHVSILLIASVPSNSPSWLGLCRWCDGICRDPGAVARVPGRHEIASDDRLGYVISIYGVLNHPSRAERHHLGCASL